MRTITKLLLGMAMPVALLAAQGASSATLITQWNYENMAAFTAFTSATANPGAVTGSNNNAAVYTLGPPLSANPLAGKPTKLSWGIPQGGDPSSLVVTDKVGPAIVNTNGANVLDLRITHNNFVINLGQSLRTAELSGALVLQPALPVLGPASIPLTAKFKIVFTETNNAAPCPEGVAPCPDIFVLDRAASDDLTDVPLGTIDGYAYTLNVIVNLSPLSNAACSGAGVANGCDGFVTPERDSTTLPVFFNIKATPVTEVPEPGILALLGLGLAGVGFGQIRRRK
jgi:PEP-CTERM motif